MSYKLEVGVTNTNALTVGGHASIRVTSSSGAEEVWGLWPAGVSVTGAAIASTAGGTTSAVIGAATLPEAVLAAGSTLGVFDTIALYFSSLSTKGYSSIVLGGITDYFSTTQLSAVLWHTNETTLRSEPATWHAYDLAKASRDSLVASAQTNGGPPPPPMQDIDMHVDAIEISDAQYAKIKEFVGIVTNLAAGNKIFYNAWETAGINCTGFVRRALTYAGVPYSLDTSSSLFQSFFGIAHSADWQPKSLINLFSGDAGRTSDSLATPTALNDFLVSHPTGGFLSGAGFADILIGNDGTDYIDDGTGSDYLYGGAGEDYLGYSAPGVQSSTDGDTDGNYYVGGRGDDFIHGGQGADTYVFAVGDGQDSLFTGGGDDKLSIASAVTGPSLDLEFKRDGLDMLAWVGRQQDGSGDFVRVQDWFTAGTVDNQLYQLQYAGVNFSRNAMTNVALHVEGSEEADVYDGVEGYSDVIFGNGGDDTIDVSAGEDFKASDEVRGGDGNDEITAGNSNDFLYGDDGDDAVDGGTGNDHVEGGAGNDSLYSWGGTSTLDGGDGDDFVFAQGTGATLDGGDGGDYVYAKGSQNTLRGGAGQDTMRTRGTSLFADGGAGEDFLWDQGSSNVLSGGSGDDYFVLEGAGATAYGGSGVDFFENYGSGNTLDGGADDDFYYSETSSFTVVMSATSGHDTLAMGMPTTGVLRVSGVLSGAVTTYLAGTSLVLSTGASSLTILDYIVDGAVNANFQGIELDDNTVPTSELPHPDPSTIRGTAGTDFLQGNGVASRIIGMGGNDYLVGAATAAETFEWNEGDGLDTVVAQNDDIVDFEGAGYSVLAQRTGNDLTLLASSGGGFVIPSWFIGQNQMSITAPDGTVWSAAEINEQFGDQTYIPSTVAIDQNATAYWTGGAPVVFGSNFAGRDIQATLSYHNYVSPSHYDLTLSDGQGTSFTFENWSQGNVSSVTMPDGTTFTPSQLNGMLHPASYSTQYAHVYAQSDWQSVVSALGPAYSYGLRSFDTVGTFMGGQQTGLYQGAPEPGNAIRRYTAWGSGGAASGGISPPEGADGAVQTVQNINASWSMTFDFWGSVFAIVDATSQYSNVVESREQARDIDGRLIFDFGTSNPSFVGVPFQVVSGQYNNAGYHDTPNVTTTRAAHLAETLYEAGTVEPPVDSFTLFDAGSAGARAMASAWDGMSSTESAGETHVSTGYLGDWGAIQLTDAGATAIAAPAELGSSSSQTTIDAWRRAASRIGEDLELPTKAAAADRSSVLVTTGYLAQRDFGEVPVITGADPLFGRTTAPVSYAGGANEFRLAA